MHAAEHRQGAGSLLVPVVPLGMRGAGPARPLAGRAAAVEAAVEAAVATAGKHDPMGSRRWDPAIGGDCAVPSVGVDMGARWTLLLPAGSSAPCSSSAPSIMTVGSGLHYMQN